MLEIPKLREIALDKASRQLLEDVSVLAHQINVIRPLTLGTLEVVQKKLLNDRVFNSNAIEGNQLTYRETQRILETGALIDVNRKRDAQEALNLGNCIKYLQSEVISQKLKYSSLQELLRVHEILLSGIDDSSAGRLRNSDVMIRAAKYQPPDASHVDALLGQVLLELTNSDSYDPVLVATWVHWAIARIHPFYDGNGRMARLWQDVVLFSRDYTASIIPNGERKLYYESLEAADEGDFNSLVQLVARHTAGTMQIYIDAQRSSDTLKSWAADIVGAKSEKTEADVKLEYLRWKMSVERFRDAFERCAVQINEAAGGAVDCKLAYYPMLEESRWKGIQSGAKNATTLFFRISFAGNQILIYSFLFAKHFKSNEDPLDLEEFAPSVCLLISEGYAGAEAVLLEQEEATFPSLREVLFIGNELVVKHIEQDGELQYQVGADPVEVAKRFFQEVILHKPL